MSQASIPKDLRPIAKRLRKQGWEIVVEGHHVRWTNPDGQSVTTGVQGSTGSDGIFHAKRHIGLLEKGTPPPYRQPPPR